MIFGAQFKFEANKNHESTRILLIKLNQEVENIEEERNNLIVVIRDWLVEQTPKTPDW